MKSQEMAVLEREIEMQMQLEDTVEYFEFELKAAKLQLFEQNTETTPMAMTLAGISEFVTANGQKVKVAPFVQGSIDKDDPEDAYEALREAGEESLIKWTITLAFGRDEQNKAEKAFKLLETKGYEPERKLGVHHSALGAALKRHFLDPNFPLTTIFNGLAGRKVTIKRPKK